MEFFVEKVRIVKVDDDFNQPIVGEQNQTKVSS